VEQANQNRARGDIWTLDNNNKADEEIEEDCSFKGVHGNCVFQNLKAFDFSNFIWDTFHSLKNVVSYFVHLLTNERKINRNWRKICVIQKIFPRLQFPNLVPEWFIPLNDRMKIDTIVNLVLVPCGVFKAKSDYAIKYPFRQFSYLKGHDIMVLLTVYFKYMLSFCETMPKAYKNFFSQFADDINEMLNPIVECSKMDDLCSKFHETLFLHDCLFPDGEKPFCLMQLLDIVHFLKIGGPIRSHWCLYGERALGKIALSLPTGGSNYLKTLFNRATAKENVLSENFISEKIAENKFGCYSFKKFDSDLMAMQLKKTNIYFRNDDFKTYKDDLLLSVVNFLITEGIDNLIMKSDLYRIRFVYDHCEKNIQNKFNNSFCDWIDFLFENYNLYGENNYLIKEIVEVSNDNRSNNDDILTVVDWASKRGLYVEDFNKIIKDIHEFKSPMIVDDSIVKGLKKITLLNN
jgi:hypothetical protein